MRRIVLLSLIAFLAGCSSEPSQKGSSQPQKEKLPTVFRLTTEATAPFMQQGDTLVIEVERVDESIAFEQWQWTVNGRPTAGSESGLLWFSDGVRLGEYAFTLTGTTADGRSQSKTIIKEIAASSEPAQYSYELVKEYPHDPDAYTQGFYYHDGVMYEGTGLKGQSSLREVDIETGKISRSHNIPARFFGEGVTIFENRLYQLTWKGQTGFIYDLETFTPVEEFYYNTEGWGLTHNDTALFMTDGSHRIYVLDPKTMTQIDVIQVYNERARMINLNELEWIGGELWANIYGTRYIARIDPNSGAVTGVIDFNSIFDRRSYARRTDVFNGIAYNAETGHVYVTGKLWPSVYEVRIVPQAP